MEIITDLTEFVENRKFTIEENSTGYKLNNVANVDSRAFSILLITSTIAYVGIVANLTVIVVFLNDKKLRRKIPNIFIINQVITISIFVKQLGLSYCKFKIRLIRLGLSFNKKYCI